MGADGKLSQPQRPERDSPQPEHLVPQLGEYAANFAILAFLQRQFQFGVVRGLSADLVLSDAGDAFSQRNAFFQLPQGLFVGRTLDRDEVRLRYAVSRVGQTVGQFPVVGQKEEAFALLIEPTDGEDAILFRHQVDRAGTPVRVAVGREDALRLVQDVIPHPRRLHRDAVDVDFLPLGVDPHAQFVGHLAVDFDAAVGDEFLALASAAEAGDGEHLLQANARWRIVVAHSPAPACLKLSNYPVESTASGTVRVGREGVRALRGGQGR
jgi:hypothetical protein